MARHTYLESLIRPRIPPSILARLEKLLIDLSIFDAKHECWACGVSHTGRVLGVAHWSLGLVSTFQGQKKKNGNPERMLVEARNRNYQRPCKPQSQASSLPAGVKRALAVLLANQLKLEQFSFQRHAANSPRESMFADNKSDQAPRIAQHS